MIKPPGKPGPSIFRAKHVAVVVRCTTHVLTYFSGDWDVDWGCGILTHGHVMFLNSHHH